MNTSAELLRSEISWEGGRDYLLLALGAFTQALALRLFLVPAQLVGGGISGAAQLVNYYTAWPIGLMTLVGNVPLFVLGWRYLGGPRFALRTIFALVAFSVFTDWLVLFLPPEGVTSDLLLNALYGGVVSGIGYGLVYRGRGTSGGSDILARILNHWRDVPISQSYLIVDALVILGAGLVFGWENALYALALLYISGLAAESTLQGSNVVRTVLVVTTRPDEVAERIMLSMQRGVTILGARGGYTGAPRTVLYTVISRAEVPRIKSLVREADESAFMVVGQAHEALGEGFQSFENN